ncbi:hypothetical protein GCM10020000_44010 [Streptomyces olivoverticillatus]
MLRRLCTARETKLQLAASLARRVLAGKELKITLKAGFRRLADGKDRRSGTARRTPAPAAGRDRG